MCVPILEERFQYLGFKKVSKLHSPVFAQPRTDFSRAERRCTTNGRSTAAALDLGLSSETAAVLCLYERERRSGRIGHKDQCTIEPIVLRRRSTGIDLAERMSHTQLLPDILNGHSTEYEA